MVSIFSDLSLLWSLFNAKIFEKQLLKKLKENYLIYAATPGVLEVQSDCDVVYVWRWRVYVLIPQPHHQEVITGNFGELHKLQTLQAVFRFTHRSGFII